MISMPLIAAKLCLPGSQSPVGAKRHRAEGGYEPGQAFEIMHRPELVDMGQHGLVALRFGLVGAIPQERVEPDQA